VPEGGGTGGGTSLPLGGGVTGDSAKERSKEVVPSVKDEGGWTSPPSI